MIQHAVDDVLDRLRCSQIVDAVPATPVLRLSANEGADSAQVALMPQEICLLFTLGPEFDGVRKCVHRLAVPADKGASKIYMLDSMLF